MRLVDHLSVAADRSALAAILDAQGRHGEAMVPLHEALTLVEAELGPDHYEVAALLIMIAGVAARANETRQARDAYSRALKIQRRVLGADHADVRETLGQLEALRRRW
jgi:Tfp pilus assembly protein PilF